MPCVVQGGPADKTLGASRAVTLLFCGVTSLGFPPPQTIGSTPDFTQAAFAVPPSSAQCDSHGSHFCACTSAAGRTISASRLTILGSLIRNISLPPAQG